MVLLAVNVKEDGIIAVREIPRRKTELSSQKQHKQFRMKQESSRTVGKGILTCPEQFPFVKMPFSSKASNKFYHVF